MARSSPVSGLTQALSCGNNIVALARSDKGGNACAPAGVVCKRVDRIGRMPTSRRETFGVSGGRFSRGADEVRSFAVSFWALKPFFLLFVCLFGGYCECWSCVRRVRIHPIGIRLTHLRFIGVRFKRLRIRLIRVDRLGVNWVRLNWLRFIGLRIKQPRIEFFRVRVEYIGIQRIRFLRIRLDGIQFDGVELVRA